MKTFLIGRGHDGPARPGKYQVGNELIETPALIGPRDEDGLSLHYSTIWQSDSKTHNSPTIVSLPWRLEDIHLATIQSENAKVLLPSLPSIDTLGPDASASIIAKQLSLLEEQTIPPPNAILRIPPTLPADLLDEYTTSSSNLGLSSASFLFNGSLGPDDFNNLVLRSRLPRNWISIALGRISPDLVPLLYYLGFDILDVGHAIEAASLGVRLWRMSPETIGEDRPPRICSCPACLGHSDLNTLSPNDIFNILRNHNLWLYRTLLSESVHNRAMGSLRWLVESMTHANPSHASLLRKIDRDLYTYLEEFTPSFSSSVQPLIGPESYNAPSIKRFRDYLVERYSPPEYKKIVLLLPCSARKPYSDSKSHKRFQSTIESAMASAGSNLSETILTSPLGVIPRELERMFPIAQYDIPVSGDWDAEETALAINALTSHLHKYDESAAVVAHVHGGYLDIVKGAEDQIRQSIIYTSAEGSATSMSSLNALKETLTDLRGILSLKESQPKQLEEIMRATADYQFGPGAGDLLIPDGAKLGGKPYRMITCRVDKIQLCAFVASSGMLSLTLDGAQRLSPLQRYWVRFEGTVLKGGSLFAVGIQKADPLIRPGDEVIILSTNDEVIGVGRSEMSGHEMCAFDNGRAVSVRHKVEVK